ncbi:MULTISPECIES: TVP38/TMEM64 family protein [Brevibacillus]|uniref:TVP38/TMEM64 family membrane protein n=1 Tax=Brevibacillus porteri TaxID=2126350 RepID=A0ABX5FU81_9BACL|nr:MULTISPECIES: VTT domain-containing protein [Brevibacillus]MED1799370.1 VTT domain-containing protein [Brevibacillus porteri]MED2132242.1 VTT domain-containing protein [Brevibacillus porteri]MED2744325.1 VTT domain-containing protein [Brevibacillus porteri]MED2814769.1 VTT domain-containing protein [Brevibacillus porteri]MED2896481.1 VTT domain-containing protein [Brevibacillus porteri]
MDWITNVEALAEWIRSLGMLGIIGSIVLNIVISVAGVLPSIFLSGANAVVFGLYGGFLISLTGEVVGACIAFFLYRYTIKKADRREKLKSFKWVHAINGTTSFRKCLAIVLLRLNPMMPSGVINLGAALTNITFVQFLVATLIGKVPSMVFETFVGHDLITFSENKFRLLFALLAGALVFLLFWKKGKDQIQEE